MKKLAFVIISYTIFSFTSIAQQPEKAKQLVSEGIQLHDKGDYDAAVIKYDEAIAMDDNSFDAYYEKSLTLFTAKKYDECIKLSKTTVEKFPSHPSLKNLYSNWGSALDDKGDYKEAIKIFDKGLEKFPNFYLLYFNKGLTYMRRSMNKEAAACYKSALNINPLHPASNLYLGRIYQHSNRIASLLSYIFFIACEPQSKRSIEAYDAIQEIMNRNISKNENGNTTISVSMDMLNNSQKKEKVEDDFSNAEFTFSLLGALNNNKSLDSITKTEAGKFDFKLQTLIGSLAEGQKGGKGFYWKHYIPFFVELKEMEHSLTLSNLVHLSKDISAQMWMEQNREKIDNFYTWLKARKWND